MEAVYISDGVSCVGLQHQDSRRHYTISKCQNLMCILGDVNPKKTSEAFGLFSLNQNSRLALGLLEMTNHWKQLFLWFCFNALPRLKFPNTEKLILLPSLRVCQKMENSQHCYSLGKRSNCSFLALPANIVMS